MNIQIFGKNKCFDTKKAERYFKERKMKYQMVDLLRYGMSQKEYESVSRAVGGYKAMIDEQSKDEDAVLLRYLANSSDIEAKLLQNPKLLRTPIVRNGKQATLGYCPDIWKTWE